MSKYFLLTVNYYAYGKTEAQCWQNLRRVSGRTKWEVTRKYPYYILEFPATAKIEVSEVDGSWWASIAPLRLVTSSKMTDEQVAALKSKCTGGTNGNRKPRRSS